MAQYTVRESSQLAGSLCAAAACFRIRVSNSALKITSGRCPIWCCSCCRINTDCRFQAGLKQPLTPCKNITVVIPPRATAVEDVSTGSAGPAPGHDTGKGTAGMAEGCRVRETGVSGNDDGLLENPQRCPPACPGFCGPENRSGHRGGGSELPAVSGKA